MARDDDEIDRLLARGRSSGPERERILERALTASAPRRRGFRRWLLFALPATAIAALFVLWPRSAFTPKGEPAAPFLDVSCDADHTACRLGSTLLFHVGGVAAPAALIAWAEPANGGERIWYFPSGDGAAVSVPASPAIQTLGRGVRIGPEHMPGKYVVHLVLARRPLSRADALAPPANDVLATSQVTIEVAP